jgi:hypothetical protein
MTLDGWVERHPRGSGLAIGAASIAAAVAYTFLLLG